MYQFDEVEHALAARDFLSTMRDSMDQVGHFQPKVSPTATTRTRLETVDRETNRATVLRIYTARNLAEDLVDAVLTVSSGATILETRGYWRDSSGNVVEEPAVIVEVVTTSDHEREIILKYADSIGAKYGERAVLITSAETVASLVYCS